MNTLALVIGNNDYSGRAKLENAINDAKAIADVFKRLGYEVIYKENCKASDYSDALKQFEEGMERADTSLFYFAGHGFEFKGENYLTSIESTLESPSVHDCNRTCIRLSEITEIINKANTKVNIIIIDACRSSFERGMASSIAKVNLPRGTIIAFSTSPGEGAKDAGFEGHSLYTGALLQYIGRESLSVEELFKKTRKTVYNLSSGTQTSWEHTSLVGDFYFNTGQLVYSTEIPYEESFVKDRLFKSGELAIDEIIESLRSSNWNHQNPAMIKLRGISPETIDHNHRFLLGRNILQSSKYAFESTNFMENLLTNIKRFTIEGRNDVLNGILFEIYFDNNGDFRNGKFKTYFIEEIFALRKNKEFDASFDFIKESLAPYADSLYYIPSRDDTFIEVDIFARKEKIASHSDEEIEYAAIESITVDGLDITQDIFNNCGYSHSINKLKSCISDFLVAPENLVNLHPNITINKFKFIDNFDYTY